MEFSRVRLGNGLPLTRSSNEPLEPVLRSVIAEFKATNPRAPLETTFRIMAPVNCDRHRIAQLLSNLLDNALNHGDADRPVRVRAIAESGTFEISVTNEGKPIAAADMEFIFQPFHRSTAGRHGIGLGLGLYIAHEIAVAHGGVLIAESNERETRFTFRMPA
jgi:signal transduction histidine kinase